MACPFFFPVERYVDPRFLVHPRLPLGTAFLGECRCGESRVILTPATLKRECNVGYGRGVCESFPANAPADAHRFHVAGIDTDTVRVQCIRELGCWPVDSKVWTYLRSEGRFVETLDDAVLQRQAQVYVVSVVEAK